MYSSHLTLVILDSYSRTYMNEFFTNLFYFFWTNTWYLYPFLFLYFFLITLFFNKNKNFYLLQLSLVTTLSIWFLNIFMYWDLNTNLDLINIYTTNFNQLLTNSINKFHPLIFYYTFLFSLLYTWIKTKPLKHINYCNLFSDSTNLTFVNKVFTLLFFTLYLGSWWALQEGSWGGWWNWDPSEVFGLVIIYIFLVYLHSFFKKQTIFKLNNLIKILVHSTLLIYVFIQLNFRLVSHNFGTKILWFINTDQFNIVLLITLFILILRKYFSLRVTTVSCYVQSTRQYIISINKINLITKTLFYSLILTQVFLSFTILVNDFLWKFLKLNVLNSLSVNMINFSIVMLVVYFLVQGLKYFNSNILIIAYSLLWNPAHILSYFYNKISFKIINMYHFLIIGLLYISYLSSNYVFSSWDYINSSLLDFNMINTNTSCMESTNLRLFNATNLENTFNMFSLSETSEGIKSFNLNINVNSLEQQLQTGLKLLTFYVNVYDSITTQLNAIFLLTLFLVILHKQKPALILF